MNRAALRYLRGALGTLGVVVACAGGLGLYAVRSQVESHQALRQGRTERDDIRTRLAHAAQEEQELRTKIAQYFELDARGVFGPERRLDWVELIQRLRRERRLPDLGYEIAPQREVDRTLLPSGAQAGSLRFMASTVRLRGSLLHEGDLAAIINDLRQGVAAISVPRVCRIQRQPAGSALGLAFECEFDWITLQGVK